MKVKIPFRGEWRKVASVHRGGPVLYTAREWQSRDPAITEDSWLFRWILYPLFIYGFSFLISGNEGDMTWFIFATVYVVTSWVVVPVRDRMYAAQERRRVGYTALFEHGLQYRLLWFYDVRFLPYSEIVDFRIVDGEGTKAVEFYIRGFSEPWVLQDLHGILGSEGMEELRARVDAVQGKITPPRLVLYGPRTPAVATVQPLVNPMSRSPVFTTGLRF